MMAFGDWRWSDTKGGMRFAFPPYGPFVRVPGGPEDAHQGEGAGRHVDDGLQGVGEDGAGAREIGGVELEGHEGGAQTEGEPDGEKAQAEVVGSREVHERKERLAYYRNCTNLGLP